VGEELGEHSGFPAWPTDQWFCFHYRAEFYAARLLSRLFSGLEIQWLSAALVEAAFFQEINEVDGHGFLALEAGFFTAPGVFGC
jgi:hypothetical protein